MELDTLWREVMEALTTRDSILEDTLAKAERFWAELLRCQEAVEKFRLRIEGIQPATGQPTVIQQQQSVLVVGIPLKIFQNE